MANFDVDKFAVLKIDDSFRIFQIGGRNLDRLRTNRFIICFMTTYVK